METSTSKDTIGKYDGITTEYKKTDELFDGTTTITVSGFGYGGVSDYNHKTIIKSQGELSRIQASGEKKIYDLMLKPNSTLKRGIDSLGKSINKGRKGIKKFLFKTATH